MKRVAIVGGAGRMGQALAPGLGALDDLKVVTLIDVREPDDLFGASYAKSLSDNEGLAVDVVVDFSAPESVVRSAQWCATHRVALVIGTTGLSPEQRSAVDEASTKTGVVIAANYSLGAVLAERFAAMAAPYFDRVEIIELHHDRKVDAPSGTSLTTARAIVDARKRARKDPRAGQQQAKLYADALEARFGQRPVIFYTNGYDVFLWDDAQQTLVVAYVAELDARRVRAVEVMRFDGDGHLVSGEALYGAAI